MAFVVKIKWRGQQKAPQLQGLNIFRLQPLSFID